MADYGLDPSIVDYLQGGGVQQGMPLQVGAAEYPLPTPTPPPIPIPVQRVQTPEYSAPGLGLPPPPPPPPPQKVGDEVAIADETPSYGLHPAVANAIQNGFAPPNLSVPNIAGMAPVAAPDLNVAHTPLPEKVVGTVDTPTDAQIKASNAAVDKQKAQQAAFEASPEGIAQKAENEQRAALDKERQANADALAAEQAQNDATAKALVAHQARQNEQAKIDEAKQAEDAANVNKYTQSYAQQVKDAADYKVDTNRDVGARGLIAIALSGIGDALDHRHGPNAAAQIIESQIDKRIADQWAQKKALGDKATETRGVLDQFRRNSDDDRQAQQLHTASELQKTADEVRSIGAQYANPQAKARAEAVAAQLDQKVAGITAGEAQRKAQALRDAQDERDKQAQIGIAGGHLALARQQFKESQFDADRNFALEVGKLNAAGKSEQAKQLQAQQEAVQERGLPLPASVDDNGRIGYEYAKNQDGQPWVAPTEAAKDLGVLQAATMDGINAVDELRKARAQFTSNEQFDAWVMKNEEARHLLQLQARALLDMHKVSGITRLSGEAVDLAQKELTGGLDADSIKNVLAELDSARGMMVDNLDANMRGQGKYTGKKITFADPLTAAARAPDDIDKAITGATELGGLEKHGGLLAGAGNPGAAQMFANDAGAGRVQSVLALKNQYATANDADRKRIISGLGDIAEKAPDKQTREYAAQVQTFLAGGGD